MCYKICVDIGTTTAKCVLFSKGINLVEEAKVEYKIKHTNGNWVQQDADEWWSATAKCIKEVVTKSGIDASKIKAIAISGQSPSFLALDESCKPLYDCIIWMDRRSEAECAEVNKKISSEKIFSITGNQNDALFLPSKFIWFEKNCPDLYKKIRHITSSNGYINYKLTGNLSYDKTNASMTLLYDIHNDCWSKEIVDALGIDETILPKLYNSADIMGYTTKEVAKELGIVEGIPVIAGTVDTMAGSVEAGIISKGDAFEAMGTSSCLTVGAQGNSPYLATAVGLTPDVKFMVAPMSAAGASYKWCRDSLRGGENETGTEYYEMEKDIVSIAPEPTNIIFLPYMAGERAPIWDSNARGVFFGMSLSTKQAHLLRAVMEGASFALRHNADVIKSTGANVDKIRAVGGGCASDMWLKIKASVLNVPVEIPSVSFGAPAGNALMTMVITGEYDTIQDAIDDCVKVQKVVQPVPEWVVHYNKMYETYKELYINTKENFVQLSKL